MGILGSFLYVLGEELVFRGLLFHWNGIPSVVSILISTSLFATIQTIGTGERAAAVFPVCGAVVVGVSNGIAFASGSGILACVIAHYTFFLCGVWSWWSQTTKGRQLLRQR